MTSGKLPSRVSLRALLAAVFVLALIAPANASAATLTKKGDIGPDGIPIPPGGKRVGNEVFYRNGSIVLRFDLKKVAERQGKRYNSPTNSAQYADCGSWFCLYEHDGWGGRMLRFRDCCYYQYLSNYGFANKATSWQNNLGTDVRVWDYGTSGVLWCSDSKNFSFNVGSADNDKADYIYIQSSDNYCD